MKRLISFTYYFLNAFFVYSNTIYSEVKFHRSFTAAHRTAMQHFYERHYNIYDISVIRHLNQKNTWQESMGFPQVGITAIVTDFGRSKLLGNGLGGVLFIQFQKNEKRISPFFKSGIGIGYIGNPFDRLENRKNIAVGSHLNFLVRIETGFQYQLSKRILMNTALNLTHFSNAAFKTPNLGINAISASIGLSMKLMEEKHCGIFKDSSSHKYYIKFAGSVKEVYPVNGPKYGVFAATLGYLLKQTKSGYFGIGSDFFYSPSLKEEQLNEGLSENQLGSDKQIGIHATYVFSFGRIEVPLQLGVYAFNQIKKHGFTYQNVGLHYNINKNIFAYWLLKTHFAKAEYGLVGIGLKL